LRAQQKRVSRVGVVVAVHINMSDDDAQALGAEVGEGLRDTLVIDVVAGAQATRRLPPSGVGELCVARPDCVKDTAQRLDADQLLFLTVVRLGKRIQVEPTWTDATGTQTASRDTIVLDAGASPRDTFAGAATRLLPDVAVRSKTAPIEQPTPPTGGETPPTGSPAGTAGGGELTVTTPAPAPRRHIHLGTWIAGGVALGALAGGVAFGLSARSAKNDLEEEGCGDTRRCADSRVDSLEKKMLWADVFYATAAISAGAAVFIQLKWGRRAEAPVSVAPTAEGGAAVLVHGAF
jgi:hypothetical protein